MFVKVRHLVAPMVVASLALGASPAGAATRESDRWATAAGERFAAAVMTCEDRTARGSLGDLRDCVRDLVPPDPVQTEFMDLWRIFMHCLSYMSDAGPDAMYPTEVYEDKVNDCLGL